MRRHVMPKPLLNHIRTANATAASWSASRHERDGLWEHGEGEVHLVLVQVLANVGQVLLATPSVDNKVDLIVLNL